MIYLYYLYENNLIKYVGLTKNINDRKRSHKKTKPSHKFIIIESFLDVSKASEAERYHIQNHNTYLNGWNESPGGEYKTSSGYVRKNIRGVKKGTVPWNKGKKGYKIHDEESLKKISKSSRGENNPKSKITENDVENIIRLYLSKPDLDGVGKIMKNGLPMSYDRLFSIKMSNIYFVTPENITRIIKKSSWKNVWEKVENIHV